MTQPDTSQEIVSLLASKLIERRDVKAIQTSNGAYMPHVDPTTKEHIPVRGRDLQAHLEGSSTFGHYLVSAENTCRIFVLDIDLEKKATCVPPSGGDPVEIEPRSMWLSPDTPREWKFEFALELRTLSYALAIATRETLDIQVLVTYSGSKGMHVIGVLEPKTPADVARTLAHEVLDEVGGFTLARGSNFFAHEMFPALSIETYPKQSKVREDGVGNLVRLPLGINRKSGRPGWFVRMDLPTTQTEKDDPLEALRLGSLR